MYTQGPYQGLFNYLFPYSQIGQPPRPGAGWGQGFPGTFPGGVGRPPGPPPAVPPSSPPGFGPGLGQDGPPPGPPPALQPQLQQTGVGILAVDPGSLYGCLRRYTYMLLEDGQRFWFWPTFIGRTSVAGYRWLSRQQRWIYTGFDTRVVLSFQCY